MVVAATPITAVFLVANGLHFSHEMTTTILSSTFLVCGIGAILQSLGIGKIGAKLPFIMVPGGAPLAIFVAIAEQNSLEVAMGAVIMTSLFYLILLPLFRRCIPYFPPFIIGIMLLLVSINLIRLYGMLIIGKANEPSQLQHANSFIALSTLILTLLFVIFTRGRLRHFAVLFGLIGGTLVAMGLGQSHFSSLHFTQLIQVPQILPYGWPVFNLTASLPLLIYAFIAMAEATGQTHATAAILKKSDQAQAIIPRTIACDAVVSLIGAWFGTSLIITSGENIGVVRTTQVTSCKVTSLAGVMLVLVALFSPLVELLSAIPNAVVCGTAIVIFGIIGVIGIEMIAREPLNGSRQTYTLASALVAGLLPILVPGLYQTLPNLAKMVLANGMAAGTLTAIILNALFTWRERSQNTTI